jgi:chromosome segregation ATPase
MSDPKSNGVSNGHSATTTPTRGIVRQMGPAPQRPEPVAPPQQHQQAEAPLPSDNADSAADDQQPVVRMRNGTTMINGQQQVSNGHAAIQRGLEVLAEQELDQNMEEIKKLDTQLDHFNKYLDTFEKKNNELTERLQHMLKNQREERLKRRSSFLQREEEHKAEQNSFESQINTMLSRCAQSRRTSVPVFGASIEQSMDHHQRTLQNNGGGASANPDDKMDTQ